MSVGVITGGPATLLSFVYLNGPLVAAVVNAWILFSFVVAAAAKRRGRYVIGWFVFAILMSPLLVGIFLLVFSPLVMPSTVNDVELRRNIQRGVGSGERL